MGTTASDISMSYSRPRFCFWAQAKLFGRYEPLFIKFFSLFFVKTPLRVVSQGDVIEA